MLIQEELVDLAKKLPATEVGKELKLTLTWSQKNRGDTSPMITSPKSKSQSTNKKLRPPPYKSNS